MLTAAQYKICLNTISANTFYLLVMDALERKAPLSVVRIADGEKKILDHLYPTNLQGILGPFGGLTEDWLKRYGCFGIPKKRIANRLLDAIGQCTYFAPSISGLTTPSYDVHGFREIRPDSPYVDNFFPNLWLDEQKIALFKTAKHVLFIHGNQGLAHAMQCRARKYHGVKVSWLPLSNWDQADGVIAKALELDAPLVVFSAGPASKYIGPRIASAGNKVTLDIGAAASRWTFEPEFLKRKAVASVLGRLDEFMKSPYTFKEK